MNLRLLVFDLDGTLIDSRQDLAESINALLVESGGHVLSETDVGTMVGEGAPVLVRRALAAAGLDIDATQALHRFLAIYEERLLGHTEAYPGLPRTLDQILHDRLTLAVLTNKPERATRLILKGLDLERFFSAVVTGGGPFPKKPDPSGLMHLIATAGATPGSTLLVGDSPVDAETARRAGVRFCVARYGFGYRAGLTGDIVVDTAEELIGAIATL